MTLCIHITTHTALCESIRKTLKEYERTLEKQSLYIREVEEEKESLHSHNEELILKVSEMEHQLAKASSSRDALTTRIKELTETLEGNYTKCTLNPFNNIFLMYMYCCVDSRQTLSQREMELLDSADKCRGMLENQISDLKKQCSSLEQEISSARDDNKALQQQLRDKVSDCCTARTDFIVDS